MTKTEILENISNIVENKGRNSMGVSESYYNPYFSMQRCFGIKDLKEMSEKELNNLYKLAHFLSDIFY